MDTQKGTLGHEHSERDTRTWTLEGEHWDMDIGRGTLGVLMDTGIGRGTRTWTLEDGHWERGTRTWTLGGTPGHEHWKRDTRTLGHGHWESDTRAWTLVRDTRTRAQKEGH